MKPIETTRPKTTASLGTDVLSNREFYFLLEKFCLEQIRETAGYDRFLNQYFNDEGYVDLWRIPNLMLDVIQQNVKFQANMAKPEFRTTLQSFVADLYTFCLKAIPTFPASTTEKSDVPVSVSLQNLKAQQHFVQSLMATFIQVLEQLSAEGQSEDAA
ncbi:MAG: hypothetical protein EOM08_03965 [Clostridia bacterium]|nr:hypothetical protein [Clostridia bacterium]NCC75574.1 hypothetical protein [Clostridia bacterium]